MKLPGRVARLLPEGSFEKRVASGALGSIALKVANAGLAFATGVVLARWLGAEAYGAYAFAFAWSVLLGVPAILGLDRLVVRSFAQDRAAGRWGHMRGLYRLANLGVVSIALLLTGIAAAAGQATLDGDVRTTFLVAMLLVPLLALTRVRKAAMQGLERVVAGQLPEMLLLHLIFLALVTGAWATGGEGSVLAMWLQVAATGAAFLVGAVLLWRARPAEMAEAQPAYDTRAWLRAALPLMLLSGIHVVNGRLDIVMLGWLDGVEAAGIYDVATKGSDLVTFMLIAINQALAPAMAVLVATGKTERLQRLLTKASRFVLLAALPLAASLLLLGNLFLDLFGSGFEDGRGALTVLTLSQLFNATAGPVGLLLIMANREKSAAWGYAAAAGLNAALNLILIPRMGVTGAALATAASTVVWNLLFIAFVIRWIGVRPTAFPGLLPRPRATHQGSGPEGGP